MLSSNHVADHHDTHIDHTVVGIDENTALVIDPAQARCHVMGPGGVTIIQEGIENTFLNGETFAMAELGPFRIPQGPEGIPGEIWQNTLDSFRASQEVRVQQTTPPDDVLALVAQRAEARAKKDWPVSDKLRDQIAAAGWLVNDTSDGPVLEPVTS
ncbi:hypothetical protein KFU94_08935 [Chloroflexi bacterium TSY]|nr:hypothetical protein [Chloroflexi bacterium TSY]